MSPVVVLDSEACWALADVRSRRLVGLRSRLEAACSRSIPVLVPALVCAEVCRGVARTRMVESMLARHALGAETPITVVPTTFDLAKHVGAILDATQSGSVDMVDAHVVALAAINGGGMVFTSDPVDMHRLAAAVPAVRIAIRPVYD